MAVKKIKKAEVSPVFCDMLSITYQPSYADEEVIKGRLGILRDMTLARVNSISKHAGYSKSYRLALDGDFKRSMLVEFAPWQSGMRYFRVVFNPSKDSLDMVRGYLDSILPAKYEGLMAEGFCTRADVTIDIHHADINQFIYSSPGISKTSLHMAKGEIQTYYLGSEKSPRRCCIYDKNAELINKGLPPYSHPVTRMEYRLKKLGSISGLTDVGNPFEQLVISQLSRIPPCEDKYFNLFLDYCVATGGQNALLRVSESDRKKFRGRLKMARPAWWEAEKVWSTWPTQVQSILDAPEGFNPLETI